MNIAIEYDMYLLGKGSSVAHIRGGMHDGINLDQVNKDTYLKDYIISYAS